MGFAPRRRIPKRVSGQNRGAIWAAVTAAQQRTRLKDGCLLIRRRCRLRLSGTIPFEAHQAVAIPWQVLRAEPECALHVRSATERRVGGAKILRLYGFRSLYRA